MKRVTLAAVGLAFFSAVLGASEVSIGFEGPPVQPPDTHFGMAQYNEAGYRFDPLPDPNAYTIYRMGRVGPHTIDRPNNGTTHLALLFGNSFKLTRPDGAAFDVLRVDLAEYSTVFPTPQSFTFTGRKADASTVTVTFTTDGVIDGTGPLVDFQTFTFPDTFRRLVSLETTSLGAYDKLVVQLASNTTPHPPAPDPEPEPEPEPDTPTRWMEAPVTITGILEEESAFVPEGVTRRSLPSRVRFGNAEILARLVSAGRISGAAGWSLRCVYDARFADFSTGGLSFAAVNVSSGERVSLDDLLSVEPLAQVMNGRLRVAADARGGYGRIAEDRFYRLVIALAGAVEVRAYGRLPLLLTVATDTGEAVGVIAPFVLRTSGHADVDSLATVTVRVGRFTRFVPGWP